MPLNNGTQSNEVVIATDIVPTRSKKSVTASKPHFQADSNVAAKSPAAPAKAPATKSDAVVKLLRATKGASVDEIMKATGWQAHSVRGFLSGTVKRKLGLELSSETGKDGARRYRVATAPKSS